jgi:hypothetical protein
MLARPLAELFRKLLSLTRTLLTLQGNTIADLAVQVRAERVPDEFSTVGVVDVPNNRLERVN